MEAKEDVDVDGIVAAALKGENVLLVGGSGVGKTHLLQRISREALAQGYTRVSVVRLDPFAAGAKELGGITLFDWLGLGFDMYARPLNIERLFTQVLLNEQKHRQGKLPGASTRSRLADTRLLLLDHLHGLDPEWWTVLDALCQACSGNTRPFGGKQIVAAADFLAVNMNMPFGNRAPKESTSLPPDMSVCRTRLFEEVKFRVCGLYVDWRRRKDAAYASMLKHMRVGVLTEEHRALLTARSLASSGSAPAGANMDVEAKAQVVRVVLGTRKRVDESNARHLQSLSGPSYVAKPLIRVNDYLYQDDCPAPLRAKVVEQLKGVPFELVLKVGARVRLTETIAMIAVPRAARTAAADAGPAFDQLLFPKNLVGTVLMVHASSTKGGLPVPVVRFDSGTQRIDAIQKPVFLGNGCVAEVHFLPLAIAQAVTVQTVLGQHLPRVSTSLDSSCYARGMAYSLCSLVDSSEALFLDQFRPAEAVGTAAGPGFALTLTPQPWHEDPLLAIAPFVEKTR